MLLRYSALKVKLHMRADGYAKVEDVLAKVKAWKDSGLQAADLLSLVEGDRPPLQGAEGGRLGGAPDPGGEEAPDHRNQCE